MKLKRRKIKRGRIEVIPMIDTIVILLIFYMTFSRFAEASRKADIKLPDAKAGDKMRQDKDQIIINMYSKDRVAIADLEFKIEDLPGQLQKLQAIDPMKTNVILRGDKNMTYTDLSDFMKACAKARVVNVTFAAVEANDNKPESVTPK